MAKLKHMLDFIKESTDISDRMLANFINVPHESIVNKLEEELKLNQDEDQIHLRVNNLYLMIQYLLAKDLNKEDIIFCLREACFPDHKNRMDSFNSANMQSKYDVFLLLKIVNLAYTELLRKQNLI